MTTYRSCWMNEDLDALRELARAFFEKEVAPNVDKYIEQHHVDRDLWNKAGELGLLCLSIPEEYGGGGGTFAHEAVLIEEQARVVDTAWGQSLHNGIVAHYLLAYGTEEQKQQWLPKMASGEVVGAIAMTEPGTGSDLQNVKTKAVRDGDEYIVNGSKTFITNGAQADLIIVVVKTDTSQGASGISLVLVEADRTGFRRGRVLDKIGQKGQDTSELFFEDVRIPVSNLLGTAEGQGFVQLMQQLPQERLIIAVGSVAGMEVALEHTLRYTKEREAFGRSVFGFQNTKFKLAEVATETKIARVFTDDCIAKHIVGELDIPTVAMAKWWTTDRAMSVASECLQLHGGYGYMTEYPISRMWVDNRVQMIYAGTNEIMKEIIARSL
ncbi:acyl-CoA dehydrogenase [Nocardia cyriacigeorgica]|uniref:Acyl-CoA dehydrogenase n=1 Tax=Nocardia cyriacigeorgica TaxID=135487 RepID=A0A6P1D627_9NOCA|nr:acyl-CoA dehydrogenase family protein [Nocardia cyriacigeorgica]NEW39363.1 acyl-CoA dehydrogenase [Nocardia cyriacigeorgica]NEW43652.1 acyl-CoA dehydrogenase [Nocardia cyriacigeorgica]NEW49868.1 acyl-CoA dehydrogenase [Nocardia cyriacigeorgica]NEW54603.1 acyl-CoA dehydrogenase [Nocardia cyriacigeorgica]